MHNRGERRYLACVNLGYQTIAAHILESAGEEEIEAIHLAENLQREELSPLMRRKPSRGSWPKNRFRTSPR